VSLTRSPADVLCVLWLWRWAQKQAADQGEPVARHDIAIMPLFEKIHDLQHGHETLGAILDTPAYREHLVSRGSRQVVMVGYSDSTKDGGYLAACWGLQAAQSRLHEAAASRGVAVTFFHGRGGSLGRGGGPAARGILSLPAETLDGSLRLTEQGEVLAERYDDTEIACRHLEQVSWATLMATRSRRPDPDAAWLGLIERMAARSHAAYRELVDEPGFIDYFSQTTPIDDIENLPIASRPARRRGQRTLDDLRAIPWVFAWTQSRCMIPAWYGHDRQCVVGAGQGRHVHRPAVCRAGSRCRRSPSHLAADRRRAGPDPAGDSRHRRRERTARRHALVSEVDRGPQPVDRPAEPDPDRVHASPCGNAVRRPSERIAPRPPAAVRAGYRFGNADHRIDRASV
jgi:phosphoenolpyruvate carboxylase